MFLKLFSEQNGGRPTRLGVFEGEPGAMTELWIEDNLPLAGIDFELGDAAEHGSLHFTHTVADARFVKIVLSANGCDIEDSQGKTTVLRFEN